MEEESILLVEDNDRLRKFIARSLNKENYTIFEASTGEQALSVLRNNYLDLVLLDLKLGDTDGIEILQTIRRQDEQLPIIIVSSINDRDIKLDGFSIGCDDYITKPFYIDELIGRVKRMLKRTTCSNRSPAPISDHFESGPFHLEINSLSVYKNGEKIEMRKKLFDLFLYFIRHPDMVFSNEQLFSQVWSDEENLSENSLYVHIRELRKLIEDNPSKPVFIKTVRNAGYMYAGTSRQ